ncbi:uncharacterized protein DNG_09761 [Cephalotrichum gorgonifer]|uniref:Lipocalin-like domain-containing protein n=1 Tax=Cephalotrichum gorgonifer TaxID=2041049 RepID=A0AAE8T0E2_9PEZI|nr:uncharacterized protein DNG_09761 [Cephalotrichum gorgonifer]
MGRPGLITAGVVLLPSLAFAFSNLNGTLQGCLDLDCPKSKSMEDGKAAICNMGEDIADATIVQDILPVPKSDTKLSVALTRSPASIDVSGTPPPLEYDYSLWLIQPEGFALDTGDDGSNDDIPEVCGFLMLYFGTTMAPFADKYGTVYSDTDTVPNTVVPLADIHNSTECPASGMSNTCMQSLESILQGISVNNGTKPGDKGRCEAVAKELENRVYSEGNCDDTLTDMMITFTGMPLLGPGAPGADKASPVKSGDDGFCFPKEKASDTFILAQKLQTSAFAPRSDGTDRLVPAVPPPTSGGYIPLMTTELDQDGKVAGNATFICLRTLDQPYWAANAAGSVKPDAWWKVITGIGPPRVHRILRKLRYQNCPTIDGVLQPSPNYGSGVAGILIYTESGYMSTSSASTDLDLLPRDLNVTYPLKEGQSDADWARAGKHTLSYTGPFSFGEAIPGVPSTKKSGQIIHGPLTAAIIPSWIGAEKARNYTIFDSDEGTFIRFLVESEGTVGQLWWKRLD